MRRGRPPHPDLLTPREQEVLALLREGLTNEQIAERLGISFSGARYHVAEILSKLGVSSRREAVMWQPEEVAHRRARRFGLALPWFGARLLATGALAVGAVALIGLAVGVAVMSNRSSDDPAAVSPAPTPSPEINDPSTHASSGYDGPVLVYQKNFNFDMFIGYDLGSGQELWSEWRGPNEALHAVALVDEGYVTLTPAELTLHRLNGAPPEVLMHPTQERERLNHVAASPDGKLLAIAVYHDPLIPPTSPGQPGVPLGPPGDLVIIYDIEARAEIMRFERAGADFNDFDRRFGRVTWRPDGSAVFLWGATHSERPGSKATLYLDGTVVRHDFELAAYVAPDLRTAVHGVGTLGCLFYSTNRLLLEDLDTGERHTIAEDDRRAFTPITWSPDSREFLYASRGWSPELTCEERWWEAPPQYFLHDVASAATTPVDDIDGIFRRWYGGSLIWMACDDGSSAYPVTNPFGFQYVIRCDQRGVWGTLHFGDHPVDYAEAFMLHGLIE